MVGCLFFNLGEAYAVFIGNVLNVLRVARFIA